MKSVKSEQRRRKLKLLYNTRVLTEQSCVVQGPASGVHGHVVVCGLAYYNTIMPGRVKCCR